MEQTERMEILSARLPQDLMEQLSQIAETERRPISMMTRLLLEEALAARAKKAKKKEVA
jgi:predicted transcriptional regulator